MRKKLEKIGKALGYKYLRYGIPFRWACYKQKNQINFLKSILSDELSIKTFEYVIKAHKTKNYKNLKNVYDDSFVQSYTNLLQGSFEFDRSEAFDSSQYFPEGIIKLSPNEVFIDGGGYIGDTTLNFIKKANNQYKKIHIFEAMKDNYETSLQIFKNLNIDQNKVIIHNVGLFSYEKEAYFNIGDSSSRITKNGEALVKLVSLDNYLSESELKEISYIKLDIEGCEMDALEGMRKTISKFKPKLAICIYHKPKDIYEIPLFIKQLNPEYKLYIRQHHPIHETVCYAI